MNARYDLIIFDCDGVLVDSEPVTNRVLARMVSQAGWPMDMMQCAAQFNGRTIKSCMSEIEAKLQISLPSDWEDEYRAQIHVLLAEQVEAVPGVEAVLAQLAKQNHPFCVASSAPVDKMQITLGRTGLWSLFAPHIYSATMVDNGKPAPDLFLHAAQAQGVEPARCLVIEDAEAGALAAKAAGMDCVGYAGGLFDHRDKLRGAGAKLITAMVQLPALIWT